MKALLLVTWLGSVASAQAPLLDVPPATTLLHDVEVRVDGLLRLTERVTWTVRIDDPEACAFGVAAPAGLDGASDQDAVVLEDLLVVPSSLPPGTVLTLRGQRSATPQMPHSGVLVGVPGVAAERTRLTVVTPLTADLSVWADERARSTSTQREVRQAVFEWGPHDGERPSLASYSTFSDWVEAGRVFRGVVESRIGPGRDLGKSATLELAGVPIQGVVERMHARLELDPARDPGFLAARPTRELVRADRGSAAERALLLTMMLRTAGFEASPVLVRPASAPGRFPVSVVAPYAYTMPAVRVERREDGPLYLDPALPPGERGVLPVTLRGGEVWAFGEVPGPLPRTALEDGRVSVTTEVTFSPLGATTLRASLTADGAADDEIRRLLVPLDDAGRREAWLRLVRIGLPEVRAVEVAFEGLDDPTRGLRIRMEARHAGVLEARPYGWAGTVPPLLAPALGSWLPPRLRIDERLTVSLPEDWQVLGATTTQASFSERAEVSRALVRVGERAESMDVEVRRPTWPVSPRSEARTVRFLQAQAREGLELIVGTGGAGRTARKLALDPRFTDADRAALVGLGWAAAGKRGKARTVFQAAGRRMGMAELVDAVARWAHPADRRPWTGLERLTRKDDRSAVTVLEGLARLGDTSGTRRLVERLGQSPDPVARARAELVRMRFLGDEIAALAVVDEAARAAGPQLEDRERWRLALGWLDFGGIESASAWLASLSDAGAPAARATRLVLDAARGAPRQEVIARAHAALAADPSDLDVLFAVAAALDAVGEVEESAAVVRTAARHQPRVPARWSAVVEHALAAGDLPMALDAAQRASSLAPDDLRLAEHVLALAGAMGDPRRVVDTYDRLGRSVPITPPTVEERLAAFPEARFAILEYADLRDSASRLAERARLRIAAGNAVEGARDGLVLARRHGRPEGTVLAYAAMAGRQLSTALDRALVEAAATEPSARVALAERALLTGAGDADWLDTARATDVPRAQRIVDVVERPLSAARELAGWPDPAPAAQGPAPAGVVPNGALGSHPGVQAWTDPRTQISLLQVVGRSEVLPPPLGLLFTASGRAERRETSLDVRRYEGGVHPLYVARSEVPGFTRYGLGFTPEAAGRALQRTWPTSETQAPAISAGDDNR